MFHNKRTDESILKSRLEIVNLNKDERMVVKMLKHTSAWVVNDFSLVIDDPINLFRGNIYFPFNTLYHFALGNKIFHQKSFIFTLDPELGYD